LSTVALSWGRSAVAPPIRVIWPIPCGIFAAASAGSKAPLTIRSRDQKQPIWASFSSSVIRDSKSATRASIGWVG